MASQTLTNSETTTQTEEHSRLRVLLESSTATIIRDESQINAETLAQRALALAEVLQPFSGGRVALLSPRIDHVVVALAAAEMAKCSVALHRGTELSPRLTMLWNISAMLTPSTISESLAVQRWQTPDSADPSPCICIPTSGTTGEPKLVRQTISALLGRIRREENSSRRPRWLFTYHPATFGGLQVLLTALSSSADLVSPSDTSISSLRNTALRHRVTHISGTPTFWRAFVSALGDRAKELPLAHITLGGEIADEPILRLLQARFEGARIRHIYASTEAGALFSVRDGRAGFPAEWLATGVEGVQLRIRDNILQVKSPRAMTGYATSAPSVLTDDGWLVTGDLVEPAGDRVYFRGRQDSTLNIGGAKVKPEEIEDMILRMPEVGDVQVYGVRNPVTGTVLAADIVPQPGQDEVELRQLITGRLRSQLETYKVPRLLKFVGSLSLNAAGKKEKRQ